MAGEALIQFTGNTTAASDLKFTPSGQAVCNVTVAVGRRKKDGNAWVDDGATFYRCAIWGEPAENVAETLTEPGMRVNVTGRFHAREYEHDGQKRLSMDVTVDTIGPDLRWATARVAKAQKGQQQPQQSAPQAQGGWGGQQAQRGPQPGGDPWATGPATAGGNDEPPF